MAIPDAAFERLRALYRELDGELTGRAPSCNADGDCCRFSQSGLSLFATTLEIAWLLRQAGEPPSPPSTEKCPYLDESSCRAREGRTLGCRLYFCAWEENAEYAELYEKYHRAIMEIHKDYDIEYIYQELGRHPAFFPRRS